MPLNREQMQEQVIRYSEQVRTVDAAYRELTDRVSDHTQELDRLGTKLVQVTDLLTTTMQSAHTEFGDGLIRVEDRVALLESRNRTFWTRVRFLFLGR